MQSSSIVELQKKIEHSPLSKEISMLPFLLITVFTACSSNPAFIVEGELFWTDEDISGSLTWFETQTRKPNKNVSDQPCRIEVLDGQRIACEECLFQAQLDIVLEENKCEHSLVGAL